jgi:diguanylate cyclase (GGDEF)-like protein
MAIVFLILFISWNTRREKIEHIAYIDPLTGGMSSHKFNIEAERVLRNRNKEKQQYVLIKFDIDQFKYINDMFGYDDGDTVLRYISDLLRTGLRRGELFSRTGDCFVVLAEYRGDNELVQRMKLFHDNASHYTNRNGNIYRLIYSCGIFRIVTDLDINKMIDRVDIVRKSLKGGYESRYAFYTDDTHRKMVAEKNIEIKMHGALSSSQFVLYLQPKYMLDSLTMVSAEALVRWIDPETGLIAPDEFVPLFEKNGFIVRLDLHVFELVCGKIREWLDQGVTPLPIAVNVSRLHFFNPNFVDEYLEVLAAYDVPSYLIELEVTESAVCDNLELMIEVLRKLKSSGFRLSLDDFGTGYSSLNALIELPVDELKLDKEFIRTLSQSEKSRLVMTSIIDMAHRLNMVVVSEGVETQEQCELLKSVGCNMGQGFLFSRPMPVAEFEKQVFNYI